MASFLRSGSPREKPGGNNNLARLPLPPVHRLKAASEDHRIENETVFCNIVGGVISPLLANLYLHWFEHRFHRPDGPGTWAKAHLVRYVDDFVILARYQSRAARVVGIDAGRSLPVVDQPRQDTCGEPEGTQCLAVLPGLHVPVRPRPPGPRPPLLERVPLGQVAGTGADEARQLLHRKRVAPIPTLIAEVNRSLGGWSRYFSHGYPRRAFRQVNRYVVASLTSHLYRRSQRPYRPPADRSFYAQFNASACDCCKDSRGLTVMPPSKPFE